jgi:parallel beta-helix repeat protein
MDRNTIVRKGLAVGIILLFAITSINQFTAQKIEKSSLPISRGNWLYVGGNGPGNYSKIQDAIENASAGSTIYVYNGTYYESFQILKSLTLIGENKYSTIIDAQKNENVMVCKVNKIAVRGFTLKNWGTYDDSGILISSQWEPGVNPNYINITDNIFVGNSTYPVAIFFYASNFNRVTDNIIMNCSGGIEIGAPHLKNVVANNTIYGGVINIWGNPRKDVIFNNHLMNGSMILKYGSNNTIRNNIIENGTDITITWVAKDTIVENNLLISSGSINLDEAVRTTVKNNTFVDSKGIALFGKNSTYWDTHLIENNTLNRKPIYYYQHASAVTVPSNASQIILGNCTNCIIKNLILSKGWGIQLGYSSSNMIYENTINGTSDSGIRLYASAHNNLSYNTITSNGKDGIEIVGPCIDNSIYKNIIINNNRNGISLDLESSRNSICQNSITSNKEEGVSCAGILNRCVENRIANNIIGVQLSYAFGTIIKRNNLINNSINGFFSVVYRFAHSNKWIRNYYEPHNARFCKIILGSIQTRFGYYPFPMHSQWQWIYRPGFSVDWYPAQVPYDIGG